MFGVFRTPEAWYKIAAALKFPPDEMPFLRPWRAKTLASILSMSPRNLNKLRKERVHYLINLKDKLAPEEEKLHKRMAPHIKKIMTGKSILLFKEIVRQIGIDEPWVFQRLVHGFPLTGKLPKSALFLLSDEQAEVSRDCLLSQASWRCSSLIGKVRSSGDHSLDKKLYKKTKEEA